MVRFLFVVFVFLLAVEGVKSQDVSGSDTLNLMTFNIYHGETMKGDFDLNYIARIIHEKQPAFVALQEVDFKTKRALNKDIATELGIRTGLAPLFGQAMPFSGGGYGVGALSQWPIEQSQLIKLPGADNTEPRVALEISVVLPSGNRLLFVSTHLDHTDAEVRSRQMQFLMNRYEYLEIPVVIAGDFNEMPAGENMKLIFDNFRMSDNKKQQPTYPSNQPSQKIDYILLSKGYNWQVLSTEVVNDSIASDHRSLYCKVVLHGKE